MICALLLSAVALVVGSRLLWRYLVESGEEDERVECHFIPSIIRKSSLEER